MTSAGASYMCNYLVELCLHSNKWNMWVACVEAQRGSSTIGQTFAPKPPELLCCFYNQSPVKHQKYTHTIFELPDPLAPIACPGCLS